MKRIAKYVFGGHPQINVVKPIIKGLKKAGKWTAKQVEKDFRYQDEVYDKTRRRNQGEYFND